MTGFTTREARYLARKKTRTYGREIVLGLAILAAALLIHTFIEPNPAKASVHGPMTNKEVCEYLQRGDYRIPAGQITSTVELCKTYGIKI